MTKKTEKDSLEIIDDLEQSVKDDEIKHNVNNIYRSINEEVNVTRHILKGNILEIIYKKYKEIIKTFQKTLDNDENKLKIIVVLTLALLSINVIVFMFSNDKRVSITNYADYKCTSLNVSMNKDTKQIDCKTDTLTINNESIGISMKEPEWISTNIDINSDSYSINNSTYTISNETHIGVIDLSYDMIYIQYVNDEKTASKELIFCNSKPNNIGLNTLQKKGNKYYEKINNLNAKAYINSYNNSFVMLTESLSGCNLTIKSLESQLNTVENSIECSVVKNQNITLNIEELGTINMCNITEVNSNPEILYTSDNSIIRIRNKAENIDYIYLFGINNDTMGIYIEDLVETTTDRLFVHKEFDNTESIGYKTFAIKTDNNLYCFKLNEMNYKTLQEEIFAELNLSVDKIELKKIQIVVPYNSER